MVPLQANVETSLHQNGHLLFFRMLACFVHVKHTLMCLPSENAKQFCIICLLIMATISPNQTAVQDGSFLSAVSILQSLFMTRKVRLQSELLLMTNYSSLWELFVTTRENNWRLQAPVSTASLSVGLWNRFCFDFPRGPVCADDAE